MKIADLFHPPKYLDEARRDRRGPQSQAQGQRGNPASPASGTGMGGPDPAPTDDSIGRSQTGGTDARDNQDPRTVRGVGQEPDDKGLDNCVIEESGYYPTSVGEVAGALGIDDFLILRAVFSFREFKREHGNVPYGNDRPSGKNARGETVRPFADDRHWHAHLNLRPNGDPMIAYRVLSPNHIRLVCVTTHYDNFVARNEFVRKYADEFPRTTKRKPAVRRPRS